MNNGDDLNLIHLELTRHRLNDDICQGSVRQFRTVKCLGLIERKNELEMWRTKFSGVSVFGNIFPVTYPGSSHYSFAFYA